MGTLLSRPPLVSPTDTEPRPKPWGAPRGPGENRRARIRDRPSQRGEQILHLRIVAERAADVDIPVHVARSENEAAPKLKRILANLMLPVAGGPGAVAGGFIVAPKHVQKVCAAQAGGVVRQPLLVDQQRKRNARILPEQARIGCVAESDGRQVGAPLSEGLLVCAQLRDVLAAEDSTVVAQEDHHGRLPLPKRAQADLAAIRIGQHDRRKRFGEHGIRKCTASAPTRNPS